MLNICKASRPNGLGATLPVTTRVISFNPAARFGFPPYTWNRSFWDRAGNPYPEYYNYPITPVLQQPCPIGLINLTVNQRTALARAQAITVQVVNTCGQLVQLTIQG